MKDSLTTKEDLLRVKTDLIDRIYRAKRETIIWIVSIAVLQVALSLLADRLV